MKCRANMGWTKGAGLGLLLIAALTFLGGFLAFAATADRDDLTARQQAFLAAGQAYDAGDLESALDLYDGIVQSGYISPELFFNIGNVYYRLGDPPRAILNYRRAWYLSPRDPDILANMQLAQNAAGALVTPVGFRAAVAGRLTRSTWTIIATAAYWLAFTGLSLSLLMIRWRPVALRASIALLTVTVMALWGASYWKELERRPETVVLEEDQQALFAPLPASTAHFEVPAGTIVRMDDIQGEWLQITADNKTGWIKRSVCQKVSLW